jgi:hypothetical protein
MPVVDQIEQRLDRTLLTELAEFALPVHSGPGSTFLAVDGLADCRHDLVNLVLGKADRHPHSPSLGFPAPTA